MKSRDHQAVLSEWANSSTFACAPQPDWPAVEALVEAARPRLLENAKRLRDLLKRSSLQFKLDDPLLCSLGVNRWLDDENSYSDWLAWVLKQLGTADLVLDVLGVRSAEFNSICAGEKVYVEREAPLPDGLPGSDGRIDLLISFGDPPRGAVGVEVKTYDQHYWKQEGYAKSLGRLPCDVAPVCVLISNDEVSERQLCGFKLRSWKEVSMSLRKAVARYAQSGGHPAVVATMLAFVGAIEQNLLYFSVSAPRRAWRGEPTLVPQDLVSYLEGAMETL